MKNGLFLLFGFGFLLAGFSRFILNPLPAVITPLNKDGGSDTTSLDESLVSPGDTPGNAAVANFDPPSAGIAALNGNFPLANQSESPTSPAQSPTSQPADPFIDNSFVTASEDPGKNQSTHPVTNLVPDRIVIPKIQLDAPIVISLSHKVNVGGKIYDQWLAPNQPAAGWQSSSAHLGEIGNTVINGHHNEYGEVFKRLIDLDPGDKIFVYSGDKKFEYVIANRLVLPERKVSLETRLANARWIEHSDDERLTLVTCWPYVSNTHRLILVAVPNR